MLENTFKHVIRDKTLRKNPLAVYLQPFTTSLIEDGYPDRTIQWKLELVACFGQWLRRSRFLVEEINEQLIETFINGRHRARGVHRNGLRTFTQFLDHLRKRGVVPSPRPIRDQSPLADTLNPYERYLRSERGLAAATIINYKSFIQKFLVERFGERPFLFRQLRTSNISDFVLRHVDGMSRGRAQIMTTAFRSFFRFLFRNGELQVDLAASVPTVAHWRLSRVPKYLTSEQVKRVLETCDRQTAVGRRDYAILLLLARLGLRAGEIVSLELADIDWRAGEILVRGKGSLHDHMPLAADVGQALTTYLRSDRPACQTRRVFVRTNAPRRGLAGASTVSAIVRCALERADLHPAFKGAHLLRHSLATSMLRSGATMGEIGEVLRHRLSKTTEIYAKVDFDALRSLAHPWPVGGGR